MSAFDKKARYLYFITIGAICPVKFMQIGNFTKLVTLFTKLNYSILSGITQNNFSPDKSTAAISGETAKTFY